MHPSFWNTATQDFFLQSAMIDINLTIEALTLQPYLLRLCGVSDFLGDLRYELQIL
jgi:hypothetical protein